MENTASLECNIVSRRDADREAFHEAGCTKGNRDRLNFYQLRTEVPLQTFKSCESSQQGYFEVWRLLQSGRYVSSCSEDTLDTNNTEQCIMSNDVVMSRVHERHIAAMSHNGVSIGSNPSASQTSGSVW